MSETSSAAPTALVEVTAGAIPAAAPVEAPAAAQVPATDVTPTAPAVAAPAVPEMAPTPEAVAGDKPAEAAPAAPEIKTHSDELPSALSTETPKPDGEAKPAPDAAPLAEPVAYEFTVPEGVTLPPERIAPYIEALKENGITPAAGQKLLDMYIAERQQDAVNTQETWHKSFADYRRESMNAIKADPELGGSGFETTKQAVARGRDLLIGTDPAHIAEFEDMLKVTGVGEQKALWRMLARADRMFSTPVAPLTQVTPASNAQGRPQVRGPMSLFKSAQR